MVSTITEVQKQGDEFCYVCGKPGKPSGGVAEMGSKKQLFGWEPLSLQVIVETVETAELFEFPIEENKGYRGWI